MILSSTIFGSLFPVVPAILGGDFTDVHRFAHDRPWLQAAILFAMTRPFPVWRVSADMSDCIDVVGYGHRHSEPWGAAFRALAESNSAANSHLATMIHAQQRVKEYTTSGRRQVAAITGIYCSLAIITTVLAYRLDDRNSGTAVLSFSAIFLQFLTGWFGVLDRRTVDIGGAREARSQPRAKGEAKLEEEEEPNESKGGAGGIAYDVLDATVTVGGTHLHVRLRVKEMASQAKFYMQDRRLTGATHLEGNSVTTGARHPQSDRLNPRHKRSLLEFGHTPWPRMDKAWAFARWLRLEWFLFFGQTIVWSYLEARSLAAIITIGIVQIIIASLCGFVVFEAILGEKRKGDRLLAAIRIHDVAVPSKAFIFDHDFTFVAWNTLVRFCRGVEQLRVEQDGKIPISDANNLELLKDQALRALGKARAEDKTVHSAVTFGEPLSRAEKDFRNQVTSWIGTVGLEPLVCFDPPARADLSLSHSSQGPAIRAASFAHETERHHPEEVPLVSVRESEKGVRLEGLASAPTNQGEVNTESTMRFDDAPAIPRQLQPPIEIVDASMAELATTTALNSTQPSRNHQVRSRGSRMGLRNSLSEASLSPPSYGR